MTLEQIESRLREIVRPTVGHGGEILGWDFVESDRVARKQLGELVTEIERARLCAPSDEAT